MALLLRRFSAEPADDARQGVGAGSRRSWYARVVCLSLVTVLGMGGLMWAGSGEQGAGKRGTPQAADRVSQVSASGSPDKVASLAAAGASLYALAEDGSAVYEATWQDTWKKIGGEASAIYGGGLGLFATSPQDGAVYKYDRGGEGSWIRVGDAGAQFAVGTNNLYRLESDKSSVSQWSPAAGWSKIGDAAQNIYAGGAGLFATSQQDGSIHRYADGRWSHIGGPGADFVVGGTGLFALAPDKSSVNEWTPSGGWRRIGGPAENIYPGAGGILVTLQGSGNVTDLEADPQTGQPRIVGGPGSTFATTVGGGRYGVSPDRSTVFRYIQPGQWVATAGTVESSSVTHESKIARVKELMRSGGFADFQQVREDHVLRGKPDPYVFDWSNNGCNAVKDKLKEFVADFKPACIRHDFGYRNYKKLLGERAWRFDGAKWEVDKILKEDLYRICNSHYRTKRAEVGVWSSTQRILCRRVADTMVYFVENYG